MRILPYNNLRSQPMGNQCFALSRQLWHQSWSRKLGWPGEKPNQEPDSRCKQQPALTSTVLPRAPQHKEPLIIFEELLKSNTPYAESAVTPANDAFRNIDNWNIESSTRCGWRALIWTQRSQRTQHEPYYWAEIGVLRSYSDVGKSLYAIIKH